MTEILQPNHPFALSHPHSKTHKPSPRSHLYYLALWAGMCVHTVCVHIHSNGSLVCICTQFLTKANAVTTLKLSLQCNAEEVGVGVTGKELKNGFRSHIKKYFWHMCKACRHSQSNADTWTMTRLNVSLSLMRSPEPFKPSVR